MELKLCCPVNSAALGPKWISLFKLRECSHGKNSWRYCQCITMGSTNLLATTELQDQQHFLETDSDPHHFQHVMLLICKCLFANKQHTIETFHHFTKQKGTYS
jgi:hypothetical protein